MRRALGGDAEQPDQRVHEAFLVDVERGLVEGPLAAAVVHERADHDHRQRLESRSDLAAA